MHLLFPEVLCLVTQSRDKGESSWLNAMPLKDQGLALNKQEFRDSLRMRYNHAFVRVEIASTSTILSHAKRGASWRKGMMESATCSPRYLQKFVQECGNRTTSFTT